MSWFLVAPAYRRLFLCLWDGKSRDPGDMQRIFDLARSRTGRFITCIRRNCSGCHLPLSPVLRLALRGPWTDLTRRRGGDLICLRRWDPASILLRPLGHPRPIFERHRFFAPLDESVTVGLVPVCLAALRPLALQYT